MATKINISLIFQKHKETLKSTSDEYVDNEIRETRKISRTDKFIFYWLPAIIAFLALCFIRIPDEKATNLYGICLSIFVGLFLNLLVMITSFLRPSVKVNDTKTRLSLIEETFYNISYTIIMSLIGLGYLFLAIQDIFPNNWNVDFSFIPWVGLGNITLNLILHYVFSFLLYNVLVKIIFALLMVIKRVFCLFNVDIRDYKEEIDKDIKNKFNELKN
ncbi:hypothetical protein [Odoribacter splanchnicus]|uniref:hypothetical protein n=1 Tax=Odoribacter splanchnicus TaxID=28118 RepID=UPI0018992868|nr:hypothetical protein [Odoribacter splanchnicus]MDB9211796.1 hypothetical protein [Odoribacter splanchnicus]MDB9227510.1 hypothetical protein [Odoribacter splanchnicus]MDB9238216.1 hypothetical protein [Odoribacter splanchnicus]MDB9242362.1 hypothetical protein [Odoribacter splanchnicus]